MADPVPIFDCLTHPTLDGGWLDARHGSANTVERLAQEMASADVRWAFAVGMGPGVGGYDEEAFAEHVRSHGPGVALYPVAFVDFGQVTQPDAMEPYVRRLRDLGYAGIKIHPRLAGVGLDDDRVLEAVRAAHGLGLATLICTYLYGGAPSGPAALDALAGLLDRTEDERVILAHAGATHLLSVAELARAHDNVLLDLSFTLCKYEGSSVDLDIAFLFRSFDRRICVGSDSPEFSPQRLRRRFEHFAHGLSEEKAENVAYKNLFAFAGLTP